MNSKSGTLRVLVVEDDRCTQKLIGVILDGPEYQLIMANNGLDGLDEIEKCCPDIIVTDLKMPHMDGIEMIREIRQRPAPYAKIPIIVITASEGEILLEAKQAGADIVGRKPMDVRSLPNFIKELCVAKYLRYAS